MKKYLLCCLLLAISYALFGQVVISDLRCEHLQNPVGLGIKTPRFSWKLTSSERQIMQTAYQIRLSSSFTFDKKKPHLGFG
ncbi:MAG: hypothetical protein HC817_14600 [Saprospiraceae bacterium]|nr:hypothetical protein [Saprospiraceae bacterium]